MIVTCERCETEFQLDEARVPEGGARVRCSRCKHAFFVMRPTASAEEQFDHAASLALDDDPTPDVTEDLPDVADAPVEEEESVAVEAEHAERADFADSAEDLGGPSDVADEPESDWEFNADLPADPGDSSPNVFAARTAARRPAPAPDVFEDDDSAPGLELADEPIAKSEPEPAREPVSRSASPPEPDADLGTPLNWDFFERGERPAAPAAAAPSAPFTFDPGPEVASEPEVARSRAPSRALRIAAEGAGWLVTAGLCALALWRGLAAPAPVATAWPEPAPGVLIEEVRGRWLDNAALGRLYVVSGRVHNAAASAAALPPLALELRDASGGSLGPAIALRGASPVEALREADAESLALVGSDRPGGLAPGVTWDFQAVVWPLPAQAARFAIRAGS